MCNLHAYMCILNFLVITFLYFEKCSVDGEEMDCSFDCIYLSMEYSSAMGHSLLILMQKVGLDQIIFKRTPKENADKLKKEKHFCT